MQPRRLAGGLELDVGVQLLRRQRKIDDCRWSSSDGSGGWTDAGDELTREEEEETAASAVVKKRKKVKGPAAVGKEKRKKN